MDSLRPQDIRIGDADREDALRALGEHFSAGRLDVDEYGQRTAKATTARTRGEVVALFADLPGPHPRFERPASSQAPVTAPAAAASGTKWWRQRSLGTLLAVAAMAAVGIGALVLFIESHAKVVIGLPILLLIVYGRVFGAGRNREDRRRRRRDR